MVARWLGYVPEFLVDWVLVAIAMLLGLIIFCFRALLWGELSWDDAIESAWLLLIAAFFVVGLPFGACTLISAFIGGKISPLACLGVGIVGAVLIIGWLKWVDPWLESRPQKVKAPCPACKSKKLMLVRVPREDSSVRYIYRCFECEWEGSFDEVWPELVNDQNKNKS